MLGWQIGHQSIKSQSVTHQQAVCPSCESTRDSSQRAFKCLFEMQFFLKNSCFASFERMPSKPAKIIYALVSNGTSVLAEYTGAGLSGNFSQVTRVLLKKVPTPAFVRLHRFGFHNEDFCFFLKRSPKETRSCRTPMTNTPSTIW